MSHPFLEGLTGGGDTSHPFLSGLSSDGTDPRLETATGRRLAQDENISANVTKLTEIMNRPDTTPEHKKRLKKIIEGMQRTDEGRINDRSNLPSPALGAGVVKGAMLPAQVTGAMANLVGAGTGQRLVDRISEAEAGVDEAFPSRGTTDEKALEMMGNMAGSAPGLGPLAELTGAPLAAIGGKVLPKAAKVIASATAAGGVKGAVAGAAKTVGKGLPLNYLFTRTQDDTGNPADKAKQMVVQAGADALFGAVGGAAGREKVKSSKPITPSEAKAAAQAEGSATDLSAETQAALATQKAKTDATVARLEVRKKAQRLARAEFELTNPDKKFNDLDKEVRKGLIDSKEQLLGEAGKQGSGGTATAASPVVDEASLPPAARPEPGEKLADYTPDPAVIARAQLAEKMGLPMGTSPTDANLNKGTRIAAAAIKVGNKVVTGTSHFDAVGQLAPNELGQGVEGWTDDKGNFLTREQAKPLAEATGATKSGGDPALRYENLTPAAQKQLLDVGHQRIAAANGKPKVGQPGFAAELAANPIKPVDPLEAKLAELKARVAKGETAATAFPEAKQNGQSNKFTSWADVQHAKQMSEELGESKPLELKATNQTMTSQELTNFNAFQGTPEEKINNIKRLGAMKRFVEEGGELPDKTNAELKTLVDKQIKATHSSGSYLDMTTKDVDTHLNDPTFEDVAAVADRGKAAESLRRKQDNLVGQAAYEIKVGRSPKWDKVKLRDVAELTGKTIEQVQAEAQAAIPAHFAETLPNIEETARDHPDERTRKFYQEQLDNIRKYLGTSQATTEPAISSPGTPAVTPGAEPPISPDPDAVEAWWSKLSVFGKKKILREAGVNVLDNTHPDHPTKVALEPTYLNFKGNDFATQSAIMKAYENGPGKTGVVTDPTNLTPKQIDKLKDQLFDRLDANPDDQAALQELDQLAEITKQRHLNDLTPEERAKAQQINAENKAKKIDPVDLPLDQPVDETIPQMNQPVEAPVEVKPTIRPEKDPEYVKLSSIPTRTKSTDQLKRFLDVADEYLQKLAKDGPDYKGVRSMMDKAATELAKRAKYDQGPIIAQMPPGVGGFVAGFTGGYVTTDDDADKVTNGLLWGLAGAAAAQYKFGKSVFHPEKPKVPLPVWEEAAAKKVVNAADRSKQPMGLMALAQRAYQMTIRGTSGLDYFTDAMKGTRLPAYKNPAKLASMRGEWLSRADGWIMGRPQTIEVDQMGVPQLVDLPVKSIKEIYDSVNGNTDKLGRVLVAYASNELRGRKSVPFDQVTSDLILGNAPEAFHQAARDIRQVHSALIDELVKADIISDAGRQKMMEEIAYAPLWKVFEQQSHIDAAGNNIIGSPNPVKARGKGSEAPVKNPYESTIEMIAKTLNNAEVNNIKRTTIDLAETNPKLAGGFIQRIRKGINPATPAIEARVAELKADIKGLSDADAQGLVTAFDQTPVSKNNIMTAFRNGVKQSYQLSDPLALTMRALNPAERPMWLELMGVPSQIARRGVTLHPWFVFMQAFRDTWQATMNSQYGFRFGIDSFIGWKNIVERSPAYREMTGAGGGNSIIQSRDFGNIQKSVESVQVGHGPNALVDAWRNLKELHPTKAYEQLIVPFAESARMGEYLRARGHGADVVDAVFAAKHVVGNFQQRGAAASMQALNHLTMFLNPALQATDQAFFRMGAHPFRTPEEGRTAAAANYLTKAFATLVVPSYLFWLANHDDQEITNIRQTPGGSRFWYMRSPVDAGVIKQGEIIRIPKPQGDGQIFGTSVETALDTWKGGDTEGASRLIDAVWGDMAPNILPQIGVLTAGIATNHDFGLGTPIVPKSSEGMEPAYQDTRNTPELMRVVSNQLNPMTKEFPNEGLLGAIKRASTPAGLQFITNNLGGMLGVDAVRGISAAIQYNEKGLAPIKAEAPIVGRFFQKTPTMYVRSVRDFYSRAERVDEVANTITELTKTKPELLGPYIEENQQYLPLISIYGQARQEIVNYTRALDDLELMGNGADQKQIQLLRDEYQRLIIDATVRANSMAHAAKQ